jgi:hypothetical protein
MLKKLKYSLLLLFINIISCSIDNTANIIPINFDENSIVLETSSFIPKSNIIEETLWGKRVRNLPKPSNIKKVTLLSYLAFDNDKSSFRDELFPMINLHEKAGSSKDINQIVFADGSEEKDTKRYYIINDNDENNISSPYIQYKTEKNSGDYITLSSFIKWGYSNYPSKIKILDINNHGLAYKGIATDDASGKLIPIPDLAKAIKRGANFVDIINFDACLMSTIEVIYELKGICNIVVSSQDLTIGVGMSYIKELHKVVSSSNTVEQLAQNIMNYSDRVGEDIDRYSEGVKIPNVFTISAIKVDDTDRLSYYINKMSRYFLNKMNDYRPLLKRAFAKTNVLRVNKTDIDFGQRDLHEVIARIEIELRESKVKDSEIFNIIQYTRESANRSIIRAMNHKKERFAEGLCINIFPQEVSSNAYQQTKFAKDTLWDEMIISIYSR